MAKDPVLPLYYNDLTTSTQDWTDEEFGAYVRLLIHQWRQGGLPKDYQRLTRIATSLDTNWPLLKGKFVEVDGLLKNMVMEDIRDKRAKHKQKQKENVLKRYQKSTKPPTKSVPLEDENENEIEKEIVEEGVQGDKFSDEWFANVFSDIWMESVTMQFKHLDVKNEAAIFKLKVRGSPKDYKDRDTGGIRTAFLYQLQHSKATNNGTRNGTKKDIRRSDAIIEPGKSFGTL